MKIRESNKHSRNNKKNVKSSEKKAAKKKKASKLSSASRVVSKITRGPKNPNNRVPKDHNKMKKYSLKALTDYFENKFNVEVDSEKSLTIAQKKFRNKYLFPSVKEGGVVYKRSDILFDEPEALTYLQMLSRTLDKSDEYFLEELPFIELSKKTVNSNSFKNDKVVIKKSSNLSTISEAWSGNEDNKNISCDEEQYIDQYEQEYLEKLKKASKPEAKKQQMKWLGKALDSYRLVENHKRSGIFYEPFVPADNTDYPITLKTIGIQLSLGLYKTYEDFKYDMKWMFRNSKKTLKTGKLLKDCVAIEKRFLNF